MILGLILGLLILWIVVIIIGFAVKALLWLAIVGVVLFVVTSAAGAVLHTSSRTPPEK
jgi:hypothetical protein